MRTTRFGFATSVLAALVLLAGARAAEAQGDFGSGSCLTVQGVSQLRWREPIVIDGDADLTTENGVVFDAAQNRYLIQNWEIDLNYWQLADVKRNTNNAINFSVINSWNGILIRNTTKNIVVQQNCIAGSQNPSGAPFGAVRLEQIQGGSIKIFQNQFAHGNAVAIAANVVQAPIVIEDNVFGATSGGPTGVVGAAAWIEHVDGDVTIKDNNGGTTSAAGFFLNDVVAGAGSVSITRNAMTSGSNFATYALFNVSAALVTVASNDIVGAGANLAGQLPNSFNLCNPGVVAGVSRCGAALAASGVSGGSFTITDNKIRGGRSGILLIDAVADIEDNCIESNLAGIDLRTGSAGTEAHDNDFRDNKYFAILNQTGIAIDATGNYFQGGLNPNNGSPERTNVNVNATDIGVPLAASCGPTL